MLEWWIKHGRKDRNTYQVDMRHDPVCFVKPLKAAIAQYQRLAAMGPLTIMVSGGVDSQASAYAANLSGVEHKVVSYRYRGLNDYDLDTTFYRDNGIEVEYKDFDIMAFHEEELIEWGHKYECSSPHMLTHMKLASLEKDAVVVFSGHPVGRRYGYFNANTIALDRYAKRSGQRMISYFFTSSPTLFHSFYVSIGNITTDDYQKKVDVYQANGFPVIPQVTKMHGFEKLKELYDSRPIPLLSRLRYKEKSSKRPYDLLYRHPLDEFHCDNTEYLFNEYKLIERNN